MARVMVRTRHIGRWLRWVGVVALFALAVLVAGVMCPAAASSPTKLLPNLVADAPDGVELVHYSSNGTTRLLLRFNGYIHNKGPGAVDFRGSRKAPELSEATAKRVKEAEAKEEPLPPA